MLSPSLATTLLEVAALLYKFLWSFLHNSSLESLLYFIPFKQNNANVFSLLSDFMCFPGLYCSLKQTKSSINNSCIDISFKVLQKILIFIRVMSYRAFNTKQRLGRQTRSIQISVCMSVCMYVVLVSSKCLIDLLASIGCPSFMAVLFLWSEELFVSVCLLGRGGHGTHRRLDPLGHPQI